MSTSMASIASAARNVRSPSGVWLNALHDWPSAAVRSVHKEGAVARVVVASVRGSAPREIGTCMLIERTQTFGTIGGGQLEWVAIEAARGMLADSAAPAARIDKLVLGTELAQCCGGVVELWIERYTRADLRILAEAAQAMRSGKASLMSILESGHVSRRITHQPTFGPTRVGLLRTPDGNDGLLERLGQQVPQLWLYGAGHVGQALVRVLAQLPLEVTWIDSRAQLLPNAPADNIQVLCSADPPITVAEAPAGTHFLVMTHSHPLDYALCRTILERGDHAWAGVIGSKSKAARFRSRLAADGFSPEQISRLECPIGISGIRSKSPSVIAVAVAAQLLQRFDSSCNTVKEVPASDQAECRGKCGSCEPARRAS